MDSANRISFFRDSSSARLMCFAVRKEQTETSARRRETLFPGLVFSFFFPPSAQANKWD
jgi:hypothetical protein